MKHLKVRIPMYFIGLFIMTIGIALSVKSNLGVSPVSSIPYTITCVWGIEMGKATILFHIVLVLLQILLLRKKFKLVQLLQILIGVVFGYFTTFCNYMVSYLPTPDNLAIRIVMVLASTVFVAFGIFLYLPADLIPLAGEGCMQAVSSVTHIEFSKVKIGFDCTMVLISAITCLTVLHTLGSVGIGTIIAAVLVGSLVGVINRTFGKKSGIFCLEKPKPIPTIPILRLPIMSLPFRVNSEAADVKSADFLPNSFIFIIMIRSYFSCRKRKRLYPGIC